MRTIVHSERSDNGSSFITRSSQQRRDRLAFSGCHYRSSTSQTVVAKALLRSRRNRLLKKQAERSMKSSGVTLASSPAKRPAYSKKPMSGPKNNRLNVSHQRKNPHHQHLRQAYHRLQKRHRTLKTSVNGVFGSMPCSRTAHRLRTPRGLCL